MTSVFFAKQETSMATAIAENRGCQTYKDYAALAEGSPCQLIGGNLIMTPSPMPSHQRVAKKLGFLLYRFVEKEENLGEVFLAPLDVYLDETEVYQPDIIFISKDRSNIIGEKKIEGPPDLVMEVLSPATAYYDLRYKKKMYAKHGVKEYWIVDPLERSIEVFENQSGVFVLSGRLENQGEIASRLLPNWKVRWEEVF
jgi:Uma2 family endonuclease